MNPPTAKATLAAALFSLAVFTPASLFAFATVPQGAVSLTFAAAANASTPTITAFTPLLQDTVPQTFVGASSGKVTSVTSGTGNNVVITVNNAGWDPLQFRNPAQPYAIRFMSGLAVGRTLQIPTNQTTNTASTVNADHQQVTVVGQVAAGDTFEIFPLDTISSFFADMVAGGVILSNANPDLADNVLVLLGGQWNTYYHDGSHWRLRGFPALVQDNLLILRPDVGYLFRRRATTPINFTALGKVPSTDIKVVVANQGNTFVGNVFPVARSLASIGVQNNPGWISSLAATNSATGLDKILLQTGSLFQQYYYDGAQGRWEISGINFTANLAVGRPFVLSRLTTNPTGRSVYNFGIPYNLN
jgi:hypothetical protein